MKNEKNKDKKRKAEGTNDSLDVLNVLASLESENEKIKNRIKANYGLLPAAQKCLYDTVDVIDQIEMEIMQKILAEDSEHRDDLLDILKEVEAVKKNIAFSEKN